jgi:hypothetical protein
MSTSMMQTAKPLKGLENQYSIGISQYSYNGDYGIAPDFQYRRGINGKSDFGLSYSMGLYGHFRADYKRSIWVSKDRTDYLSTGVGLDLWYDDWNGYLYTGFTAPLYMSFNHGKRFVPYFAQRFTFAVDQWSGSSLNDWDYLMAYSGVAGLRIGENLTKMFVELSYSISNDYDFNLTTQSRVWYSYNSSFQLTFGFMILN